MCCRTSQGNAITIVLIVSTSIRGGYAARLRNRRPPAVVIAHDGETGSRFARIGGRALRGPRGAGHSKPYCQALLPLGPTGSGDGAALSSCRLELLPFAEPVSTARASALTSATRATDVGRGAHGARPGQAIAVHRDADLRGPAAVAGAAIGRHGPGIAGSMSAAKAADGVAGLGAIRSERRRDVALAARGGAAGIWSGPPGPDIGEPG